MIGNKRVLAASLLAFGPIAAHAVETSYIFDSVSAVQERNANISITGILVNGSSPITVVVPNNGGPSERCDRKYDLALSQPGAYTLTVTIDTSYLTMPPDPTPVLVTTFIGCTLALKP